MFKTLMSVFLFFYNLTNARTRPLLVGESEPLSSDLLPLEEEDPMRGSADSHSKGWCQHCKPGKGGRPLLAAVADPHSKDKSLSKAEMAAMKEAAAATAEKVQSFTQLQAQEKQERQ